jgi:hypothetical protein
VTRIVAQDGDTQSAESIQRALGFGQVVVESTGFLESDVTIQFGRDWLEKYEKKQQLKPTETETETEANDDLKELRIRNSN